MKKKQITGLIIAAIIFCMVGASSVFVNTLAKKQEASTMNSMKEVLKASGKTTSRLPVNSFIGIVKVEGTITSSETSSLMGTVGYSHRNTLDLIDRYTKSVSNKGILLYVNSPGGGVYESDELYLKLKEYKEKTGRPIWTYMAAQACSGGYYISMASDQIYENRNGMTGSIGVIMSMVDMTELYKKLGIKEVNITSGVNKAMGSAGQTMTEEQKEILQDMVNEPYEQFVEIVAEGRHMTTAKVKKLADGRIYTPKQALKLGLIDTIDTYENMKQTFKDTVGGNPEIYEPAVEKDTLSSIFGLINQVKPRSQAEIIKDFMEKQGSGVPMYYANTGIE